MTPPPRFSSSSAAPSRRWHTWRDDRLLRLPMRELKLGIAGTEVETRVDQLREELEAAGIVYRPNVWLSDEWFSSPDCPGIAVPFYLAHPRLKRLERRMMFEVEGGTRRTCMRLLRHECGHAIQFAYGLHRMKLWRETFGRHSMPYPEAYRPKPFSRDFVLHLSGHYAQAHPDEDFAETFAVWLAPGSDWAHRYRKWPAIEKLRVVDELMRRVGGTKPVGATRRRDRTLATLTHTLGEHYAERQARYGLDRPEIYDRDLKRIFPPPVEGDARGPASRSLRRWRRDMLKTVGTWTGQYAYAINNTYDLMIGRASRLKLRLPDDRDEHEVRQQVAVMLTVQTMHHIQRGGRWLVV